MRKLLFSIPVTIDGYIEGPRRELDWVIADDELHDFYSELLQTTDLILYGRVTYELMRSYWPTAATDLSITPSMRRFASTLNPMKKIVYSSTLKTTEWNTQVIEKLDPVEIINLKAQPGKDIALGGGASLAQAFMKYRLIDEFQLMVMPVVLGAGNPLFKDVEVGIKLNYQWSKKLPSGAIALCYRPDGKA